MSFTSRIVFVLAALATFPALAAEPMIVYKPIDCSCCANWIKQMKTSGFKVNVIETKDMATIKHSNGIPDKVSACHTAKIGNYVLEGHVPAADIQRLLAEKPVIRGLVVPGMPSSAPGMDKPGHPYEVLSLDQKGNTARWAAYPG